MSKYTHTVFSSKYYIENQLYLKKVDFFLEYVENKNQMSIHILFENNKTELLTEAILMSVKSFKYIQNS